MEQYAAYLRKSRADIEAETHGEGETLIRHEHILLDLAHRMGICLTAIYREIVSGDSIDARPEVQKLLNDVELGMWAGVLVVDVDRLARGDTIDQGIIARTFKLASTKIITPNKIYDPLNEFDEEYFEFGLFMARREYKMISRRIQRGRIESVKSGKYVSSVAPYGYDRVKIPNDKGYTLSPNAEADVVKLIYQMYLDGKGCTVIANTLNDMHIIPRNTPTWSKATIRDILSNPVYYGKLRWSYRPYIKQSVNGKVVGKRQKNKDCMLIDGLHEPLISESDFNRAMEIRTLNKKAPLKTSTTLQNPFTGLLYCAKCGSKMTRLGDSKRNKWATVRCTNRKCDCVSAPIPLVETLMLDTLRRWMLQYTMQLEREEQEQNKDNSEKLQEHSLKELRNKLGLLDTQLSAAYDLLEQGVYTTDIFMQRSKQLSERKSELEKKISKIKQNILSIQQRNQAKYYIIPQTQRVIESYMQCGTAEEKNNLLRTVLSRIDYDKSVPNRRGNADNINFTLRIYPKVPTDYLTF